MDNKERLKFGLLFHTSSWLGVTPKLMIMWRQVKTNMCVVRVLGSTIAVARSVTEVTFQSDPSWRYPGAAH